MHLVNCAVTIAPWTLPGPIGAYLACGGDWRAAVLNIILIIISVIIYYPFFKVYDRQCMQKEEEDEKKKDQLAKRKAMRERTEEA